MFKRQGGFDLKTCFYNLSLFLVVVVVVVVVAFRRWSINCEDKKSQSCFDRDTSYVIDFVFHVSYNQLFSSSGSKISFKDLFCP